MNQGILKKIAIAGIAMLLLAALASGIGQAGSLNDTIKPKPDTVIDTIKPDIITKPDLITIKYAFITYKPNYTGGPADVEDKTIMLCDYTIRTNPFTDSGFIFTGWNTKPDGSGNAYYAGQTVGAYNTTLYAQWKVTYTYKPNYVGGPANVTNTPFKDRSYTIIGSPFPRPGYIFDGWNTQPNGSGNALRAGQVVTVTGNTTLYAQWKVTITYKPNYTYTYGPADVEETVKEGSSYTVKTNLFDSPGYMFTGWYSLVNRTVIKPGQVITVNTNMTLYAQWEELPTATGVDGRILPPAKTGDNTANWIEIARDGKYSLIVRSKSVQCMPFSDTKNGYLTSYVRGVNDAFFNSKTVYNQITLNSTLPDKARLRDYTVKNNAVSKLGTCCTYLSLSDGYSKPTSSYARSGNDICFALSYTEAANFFSIDRFNSSYSSYLYQPSPAIAKSNYLKLPFEKNNLGGIWLRSSGYDVYDLTGMIHVCGSVTAENPIAQSSNYHPALWVDSAIFN